MPAHDTPGTQGATREDISSKRVERTKLYISITYITRPGTSNMGLLVHILPILLADDAETVKKINVAAANSGAVGSFSTRWRQQVSNEGRWESLWCVGLGTWAL